MPCLCALSTIVKVDCIRRQVRLRSNRFGVGLLCSKLLTVLLSGALDVALQAYVIDLSVTYPACGCVAGCCRKCGFAATSVVWASCGCKVDVARLRCGLLYTCNVTALVMRLHT